MNVPIYLGAVCDWYHAFTKKMSFYGVFNFTTLYPPNSISILYHCNSWVFCVSIDRLYLYVLRIITELMTETCSRLSYCQLDSWFYANFTHIHAYKWYTGKFFFHSKKSRKTCSQWIFIKSRSAGTRVLPEHFPPKWSKSAKRSRRSSRTNIQTNRRATSIII